MNNAVLLYMLKSAFVLALLYVPYLLVLRWEKFFRLNRAVLLATLALSLVLPLLNVDVLSFGGQPMVRTARQQMVEFGVPLMGGMEPAAADPTAVRTDWFSLLARVALAGAALALAWRVAQLVRVGRVVRRGVLWTQREASYTLYCHAGEVRPFSWMRSIVISEADYRRNSREILLHEQGHILHRHSLDLLLLAAVEVVQWWNPLVYLLGQSLREVHEYQADDHVLSQGISARGYQLLLIKKAVGSSSYAFANDFNHSLTKNRITMMQKNQSRGWARSKALYLLPMAAVALSAMASPKFSTPLQDAANDPAGKVSLKMAVGQTFRPESAPQGSDNILDKPEVPSEYPGNTEALYRFLAQDIKYPALAQKWGVQGKVLVDFVIERDGRVSQVQARKMEGKAPRSEITVTAKANDKKLTPEEKAEQKQAAESLMREGERVVKTMPNWKPGMDKGKPCRTRYTLPIMFKLR